MNNFQARVSYELEDQGIYPALEDVLVAFRFNARDRELPDDNAEWAAEVFDAVLCAFDLYYENANAADRIAAASLAIKNLEKLINKERS